MKNISLDIRHGLRRLRLAPAFTLFAIVTLALGIGATTAIYSAIGSLFTPPNISDIDRVVNIYHMKPPGSGPMVWMSWPDYQDLKAQQTHLGQMAAWTLFREAIVGEGPTERIVGEMVSGDYFALVGARPELGRLLQPDDDQPNAAAAAVISHAFWQRWFSGDPSVIGHTVRIGNEVVEIVGVVESGFRGVNQPGVLPTPVWISTALGFRMDSNLARRANEREARQFSIKGRLKPDSTIEDVRKEIDVIAGRLDLDIPIGRDRDTRSRMPYATSRKWYVMPASAVRLNEGCGLLHRADGERASIGGGPRSAGGLHQSGEFDTRSRLTPAPRNRGSDGHRSYALASRAGAGDRRCFHGISWRSAELRCRALFADPSQQADSDGARHDHSACSQTECLRFCGDDCLDHPDAARLQSGAGVANDETCAQRGIERGQWNGFAALAWTSSIDCDAGDGIDRPRESRFHVRSASDCCFPTGFRSRSRQTRHRPDRFPSQRL